MSSRLSSSLLLLLALGIAAVESREVLPCTPTRTRQCCGDGVCHAGEDDQSCPEDCVLGSSAERALPQKLSPGTIRRADFHQENLRER